MKIDGDAAKGYAVIRLDSFATVNAGILLAADEDDGSVAWMDTAGETKRLALGARAIKIVPRRR